MSREPPLPASAPRPRRGWLLPLAILAAEVLVMQTRFRLPNPDPTSEHWSPALAVLKELPRVGLVALTSLVLLGWKPLGQEVALLSEASRALRHRFAWLAAQLLAFGALWITGASLLDRPAQAAPPPALLIAAFVTTGLLCTGLSLRAVAPSSAWLSALRRQSWLVLAALLSGLGAWAAGLWSQEGLREVLRGPTLRVACFLLRLVVAEPLLDEPNFTFGTSKFLVQIAPGCSGLDGVGLILAFTLVWLVWMRRELRFPLALLLLPFGAIAAWMLNAARLSLLVVVGDRISPEVAIGGFHSAAGLVLFCGTAVALVALGNRAPFGRTAATNAAWIDPTVAHLLPLMLWVLSGLLAVMLATEPAVELGVRIVLIGLLLFFLRSSLRDLVRRPTLAGLIVGGASIGLALLLPPAQREGVMLPHETSHSTVIVPSAFATIVLVPVLEELAFRGYLMRRLHAADFKSYPPRSVGALGIAVSSLAFGLVHPAWISGTLFGVLFALAYSWKGRLSDAIFAHAMTNLALLLNVVG